MTRFLEQFLSWVAAETLLSGILFLIYSLVIRRFKNSIDRFNFLSISFAALLFLPWIPTPTLSEPILGDLISAAAMTFQDKTWGHENLASQLASFLGLIILPFTYFSVLTVRVVRIIYSLGRLDKIARSVAGNTSVSNFPLIIHNHRLPPMTLGVINPKILISKIAYQTLSRSELDMIIQHEEEHIRRGDGAFNFVRVLIREILFFSPFVWILAEKLEEEMEISVDAALVERRKYSAKVYGTLLLRMAELSQPVATISSVGTFLSHSALKRRLIAMKNTSQDRSKFLNGFALGGFILLSSFGVSLFGSHAYSSSTRLELTRMKSADLRDLHGKPIWVESNFSSKSVSDCDEICTLLRGQKDESKHQKTQF